jgi:ubiquinone/menaquinone biosynthesis C-methylase UbiE
MMTTKYPGLATQPDEGRTAGPIVRMLRPILRAQFGQPSGILGQIAGQIMANTKSNTERTRWTLSLLDLQPEDRVLEIGFGPGIAIELASEMAPHGLIVGVDHSEVMFRQASRRNRRAIRDGKVELYRSSAEDLPRFDEPFDKIFSINSIHFWPNPAQSIDRMRRILRPGGLLALTIQPQSRNATSENTRTIGEELISKLRVAGFTDTRLEVQHIKPMDVACAIGHN